MKRAICHVACVGTVLAAGSVAQAGFVYRTQERSLFAVASNADGSNAVTDTEAASDFGPFDGEVFAEYFDPPEDLQTARGTQSSRLAEDGIFAEGLLRITADDERAIARTRVHVDFDVEEPTDYELALSIDYIDQFINRAAREQPGAVRLTRVQAGPDVVVAEKVFNREEDFPIDDLSFDFTDGGTLEGGRYRIELDLAAVNEASNHIEILEYSFSLRDVGGDPGGEPNPIPLPPAAWAGLMTMAGIGATRLLPRLCRRG